MPTATKYTYSIVSDFPGGAINTTNLAAEIQASSIVTALDRIDTAGDVDEIWFKDALSASDETTLDNDAAGPAGGLIAAHDNSATAQPAQDVAITNHPSVQIRKPSGLIAGRVYGFSVNFADKTTWYHDAVEVTGEAVGTGDGATTVFNLARGTNNDADERVIDMCHGKMSDENRLANPRGEFRGYGNGYVSPTQQDPNASTAPLSGYVPIIYVDGVEQTERSLGETDGDYEINYVTGAITFYSAPANGLAITATYWYAPATGKAYALVIPSAGKRYMIDRVEIQSDPNACFNCDLIMNVYAGAAWPNGFPLERPTVIKKVADIVNWAYGASPQIPIQGGANVRALSHAVNIHQVRYTSEIPLLSSAAMYMQVSTALPREFDGEWATVVIYGIEEPE